MVKIRVIGELKIEAPCLDFSGKISVSVALVYVWDVVKIYTLKSHQKLRNFAWSNSHLMLME